VDQALNHALSEVSALSVEERLNLRYEKFRRMGEEGSAFVDKDRIDTLLRPT
jgi:acetyl-CoA carboxylase alpha subunit